MNTKHNKSPSLQKYGVTRGWLPQRAGLPGLNGGGARGTPQSVNGVTN